jgi:hypothetical protein
MPAASSPRPEGTIRVTPFAYSRAAAGLVFIAAIASIAPSACAQGRVEATYRATLAGIPIGSGNWIIDIRPKQYAGAATGRASGLMRVLASGEGSSTVRGTIKQGRLIPSVFHTNIHSHDSYQIHMEMSGGNVKTLKNDPPVVESPDRIPLTDAHRRGVLDPMSALMITVPGKGDVVSSDACQAKLPIFDGRQRFYLILSFKRMDTVESEKGYSGSAVVCSASYVPIAGHRPGRYVIRYLQETRDIEIWFAPIAGTRVLIPYRVSIPTLFGNAILQAAQFETEAQLPSPTRAANPSERSARGS